MSENVDPGVATDSCHFSPVVGCIIPLSRLVAAPIMPYGCVLPGFTGRRVASTDPPKTAGAGMDEHEQRSRVRRRRTSLPEHEAPEHEAEGMHGVRGERGAGGERMPVDQETGAQAAQGAYK